MHVAVLALIAGVASQPAPTGVTPGAGAPGTAPVSSPPAASTTAPATRPVVLVLVNPRITTGKGFVDSLQIQLSNSGVVRRGPVLSRGSLAVKLERARNLAAQQQAELVVWIERSRVAKDELVLFVVNPRRARSNVELFRIRARFGPDVARTLALKVSDVLDQVIAGTAVPSETVRFSPPPVPPPPPERRWVGAIDSRGSLSSGDPSAQLALTVALGRRVRWQEVAAGFGAGVTGDLGVERAAIVGEVSTREVMPFLYARVLRELGGFWLSAGIEARLRLIRATGITAVGREGSRVVPVPTGALLVGTEIPLSSSAHLRLNIGAEVATRRRKFAVNGVELVDVGRFRGAVDVGFIVLFP